MLNFCKITTDYIEIPDKVIREYIEECKNKPYIPDKDDLLDWVEGHYFIDDFIVPQIVRDNEYTLTDKQFNLYLENLNND